MENTLDQKVDRIEKAVEKNTQSIDTLAVALGQNTKDISSLTTAVAGLAAAVAQNTKDITSLTTAVTGLTSAVAQNTKDIADLVEIVGAMKGYMETKLATKDELAEVREQVIGKAEGVQRGLDAQFERHSGLEARVSKIEVELHPEVA